MVVVLMLTEVIDKGCVIDDEGNKAVLVLACSCESVEAFWVEEVSLLLPLLLLYNP